MRRNILSVLRTSSAQHLPRYGAVAAAAAAFSRNTRTPAATTDAAAAKAAAAASNAQTATSATTAAATATSAKIFAQHPSAAAAADSTPRHGDAADATAASPAMTSAAATRTQKQQARRRAPPATVPGTDEEAAATTTTTATASAEATIGIKLSADDELVRAFNRFSRSVGGCTEAEFLQGAQQAYYSTGTLAGLLAEHAKPVPGVLTVESFKVMAAAEEARKLLDTELLPEKEWKKEKMTSADLEKRLVSIADGDKAAESAVQRVVNGITSILPVSRYLATTLFKVWCMQKEKKANLFNVAGPSDFVIDSKLVVLARLDNTKIYFADPTGLGVNFEVVFAGDYLQQKQRFVRDDADGEMREETVSFGTDGRASLRSVDASAATSSVAAAAAAADRNSTSREARHDSDAAVGASGSSGSATPPATKARIFVSAEGRTSSAVGQQQQQQQQPEASAEDIAKANDVGGDANRDAMDAVCIKVNGSELPPIPSTAQACVLLTMDVVVPPERYAGHYEWYYNRIVGYESEYERIAAARIFAQNTPKSVASFFDFITRMFTGKPVEFMLNKAIGSMVGLPDNVSECPPATRKLVCMYMDPSNKWILSDLIPIAPVMTTKLPATK